MILHRAYGLANRAEQLPLRTDMPMLIGSLGKQFTATAILRLEMDGKLSTADSIGRFFPDAPAVRRGITIHQLLTHTAGLPYLPSGNLFERTERAEVMRQTLALPLVSAPGSGYAYSSPGYTLLAGIVEKASGERFESYLRRMLFVPAGMTNTAFEREEYDYIGPLVVHSYSGDNDEGAVPEFPYSDKFIGAGTIISTTSDLYKWEQALASDRILSAAAREKLFTPYVTVQGPTPRVWMERRDHASQHAHDLSWWRYRRLQRRASPLCRRGAGADLHIERQTQWRRISPGDHEPDKPDDQWWGRVRGAASHHAEPTRVARQLRRPLQACRWWNAVGPVGSRRQPHDRW